jgi:hypothetical protein
MLWFRVSMTPIVCISLASRGRARTFTDTDDAEIAGNGKASVAATIGPSVNDSISRTSNATSKG